LRDILWKVAIVVLWIGGISAPLWAGISLPASFEGWFGQGFIGWLFAIVASVSALYLAATFYHGYRYQPSLRVGRAHLPTVTLVVPAYNEGPMVRVSLESALANDYPRDKLQILAIDDGSTDDTWVHILAIARKYPDVVTAVAMPKNGGKREALLHGFRMATGEVVVTVDSDSKLSKDAIANIVAPLVRDSQVAAVAGKVVVLNRYANFLTRLLSARFYVTFDLGRAAQSRFGAVLCCPGALAAYRRSALLEVIDSWSTQLFLGMPCTIGEDRALTTWLMRAGYRSVYQSTAIVETLVPTTLRGMVKMFIRWERGNLREDFVMLPILFTRWRTRDRWWPTFEIAFELLQLPLGLVALGMAFVHFAARPADVLIAVGTVGTVACAQSLYAFRSQRDSNFLFGIAYAFVALFGLQWILPYSALTIRDGRWLTR
jgi:hyaluronan synthase